MTKAENIFKTLENDDSSHIFLGRKATMNLG